MNLIHSKKYLILYLVWYFILLSYTPFSLIFGEFFVLPIIFLTVTSPTIIILFFLRKRKRYQRKLEWLLLLGPIVFLLGTIVDLIRT